MDKNKSDIRCTKCGSSNVGRHTFRINVNKKPNIRYRCYNCNTQFTYYDSELITRIVAISDLHCGHENGMVDEERLDHANDFQKELFKWFVNQISLIGSPDIVIANGDLIDGRQDKSGGSELIVSDRLIQAEMASNVLKMFNAKKYYITRGTPYHTGKLEEFENLTAKLLNAEFIGEELRLVVNKTLVYARHKVGNAVLPYSYFTSPARNLMFDSIKNAHKENPMNIGIALYAHVHRFSQSINSFGQTAITMPAMQGYSKYGGRECDGIGINIGFLVIDVFDNGTFNVDLKQAKLKTMNVEPLVFNS